MLRCLIKFAVEGDAISEPQEIQKKMKGKKEERRRREVKSDEESVSFT